MDRRKEAGQFGLYDARFEHDSCGVGFVCDVKGRKSNRTIAQGLEVLRRLKHRGATGADPRTGDGAGILIQMPHAFFNAVAATAGISLSAPEKFGTGLVFLPTIHKEREFCKRVIAAMVKKEGCRLLGWRVVPVEHSVIGTTARESAPCIEQPFIAGDDRKRDALGLERTLYLIRKQAENAIRSSELTQKSSFYITNFSCRTFSYKGLLMPQQVEEFFLDLKDRRLESSLCMVHSRYSTNTFPTWDLAQPFRFLAHNGEINTLRGNINWMRAREGLLKSRTFGASLKKIYPTIVPGGSDSATLDNVFELLVLSGRPLEHAMMMLIPAAWQHHELLDKGQRDFYAYHSCFMEPWDGPAAIAFSDGTRIGAMLDRNGLRPARYIVTRQGSVIMASEAGVLDVQPSDIVTSGRLEPGKVFFIDTASGCIVSDEEIKKSMATHRPWGKWIKENTVTLGKARVKEASSLKRQTVPLLLKAFGYTREDLKVILQPMAETAQEPIGSMGNDTPHAVLSKRPQLLYTYFKQLFAQVTNPAIDPIREELVMSLQSMIGPERNILDETPRHAHKLKVEHPILADGELAAIASIKKAGFKTRAISTLFDTEKRRDFDQTLSRICREAQAAIASGYTFIILSDRGISRERAALPALLAVGAVHHHLVRNALRTQIGIVVESGEPREVHHLALLFGYGADCINPYLAYAAVRQLVRDGECALDAEEAVHNYIKAAEKGILKILSKMGISTLQSYRGAQIFEALGVHQEVIERCFSGTVSRIGGATFGVIAEETLSRHQEAFATQAAASTDLASGGLYQWKRDGEFHLWNPETIHLLQEAVWREDFSRYREFSGMINDQSVQPTTLRSLLQFVPGRPIPLDEVEPVEAIVRRFATGAMSFGSISRETHESIAIALNRLGGRSNTGEGGEDPARFTPLPNGDSACSRVKQVASGRFGVTTNYLVNGDELQIKIAQGAKPGEGGQLPGHKVSVTIAATRYTTPGVTLISPPPHHDIYSIEDLAQLIFDLKNANPRARISVKLVSEIGVGTVAAGVAKGHADMILISGGDGGTGASPLSSIKHAGLPWELGLSETHQTLLLNDLRSRVRLQTDGQMRTGRDIAVAALLGAEEFGFCTAVLISLGCVMLRHCHLNNCSVGVATQEELLCRRFKGRPEYVVTYLRFVAEELRQIMGQLGIRTVDEMVGRTELLAVDSSILPWKAKALDLSRVLYKPAVPESVGTRCVMNQDHAIDGVLDRKLIERAAPSLTKREPVAIESPISNVDRTTGAMLSGTLCRTFGEEGLPEDTIRCIFRGVAGQSFAAFLAKGITFELEGMANDYIGKGISGGKVIVYPDRTAVFSPQENIIIGNTTFYGAIAGEAYIRGIAGERFCIRNSGLHAIVEGVGDHGCEYMTGGRVVVLGQVGRNFAAGMSGGIAYVYDPKGEFPSRCNRAMVELEKVTPGDAQTLKRLLANHHRYTKSDLAGKILDDFDASLHAFVKVMPLEYKRILDAKKAPKRTAGEEVLDG